MREVSNPRIQGNPYPTLILRVWNKLNPKKKWHFILDYDNWYQRGSFTFFIEDFYNYSSGRNSESFTIYAREKHIMYHNHHIPANFVGYDFIENPQIFFTAPKPNK